MARKDPKGPPTTALPDSFKGRIPAPRMQPCKASCCKSPYGHATGRDFAIDSLRCKCHDDQKGATRG